MEAALDIHDYLPLAYARPDEDDYIRYIWDAFNSNYQQGHYQFALLALHILYVSYEYFSVWQIREAMPQSFASALLFPGSGRPRPAGTGHLPGYLWQNQRA